MKKILLLIILLAFTAKTFSQDYYRKSKNQKTTAWVLLSVGTTMTVVGLVGGANTLENSNYPFISEEDASTMDAYGILLLTGIAADLASIPFFISASKNKRLAGEVKISNQKMYVLQKNYAGIRYVPGVTVKISF